MTTTSRTTDAEAAVLREAVRARLRPQRRHPLDRLALRVFRVLEVAATLVLLIAFPVGGLYLLLVWIGGPYAVAALPLAVALGLIALMPVSASMHASRYNQKHEERTMPDQD